MSLRICFVGDSITNGYGDSDYRGWPSYLSTASLGAGADITAYNLGVRSDTSTMVRARWRAEAEARLPAEMDCALVFSFGINDCARIDGQRRVDPAQSMENAEAILSEAKAWLPAIFIGPTPVDGRRDTPQFLPGMKLEIRNDLIADMNGRLETLCGDLAVPFVDLINGLDRLENWHSAMAAGDGVHPTAEGYALIAQLIGASAAWRGLIGGKR